MFSQEDLHTVLYDKKYSGSQLRYRNILYGKSKKDSPAYICRENKLPKIGLHLHDSLPKGLEIKHFSSSHNQEVVNRVFSVTTLGTGTRFGPYTGKIVHLSEVKAEDDNSRMWEIYHDRQLSHYIDGRGLSANWMTYVRCARDQKEQNLAVIQCGEEIFYQVCDAIDPGNELLVWYGEDYEMYFGIPIGIKQPLNHVIGSSEGDKSTSNEKGFQCPRCFRMFAYSYYRDKHLKFTPCVDQGDRQFPCHLCLRSFEKKDRLRIHVLHVHQRHKPHVCHVCEKRFSQSSSLSKHLRVHSGERPYKCVYCGKAFTASSILRTHIRQHSGEKPFKCKFCGKSFASHAAHDSHVRRTHTESADLSLQEISAEKPSQRETTTLHGLIGEATIGVAALDKTNSNVCSFKPEEDFINVVE